MSNPTELGPPDIPIRRLSLPRIVLITAATALVLALPVIFFALRGPTPTLEGAGPPLTPSPTASATPSPSPTPTGPAPDRRTSATELRTATLDIPPWPPDNLS